jgi:fructuronate reductase
VTRRLSQATLGELPPHIARPRHDRTTLQNGIVHLGLGAFHRAHQAVMTDAVLAGGDTRWGITAASLRSPATRDALAPQDGLYTLDQRGVDDRQSVIGSITRILVAPEDPAALVAAMAHPHTHVVSLTVTEKAYCRDPASGALDAADPAIRHDLANPQAPRSVFGFLAASLARRRAEGLAPFTVLCCDNLPANGQTVRRLLTRFATLQDRDLGAWLEDALTCPDTMVDRIVPATTDADRARVAARLGLDDAWPVIAEPFSQWVIEDRFTGPRPAWESAGATLVADVAPFETMKLRLLNGSHSALAYLGSLAGHETVADAMADPGLAAFIPRLMQATAPTLAMPAGTDLTAYQAALLERFRNPALRHRTLQIAMDGSQKLPQRLLAPMAELLAAGRPITCHAMAVAAWMRHIGTTTPQDPMVETLMRLAAEAGPEPQRLVPALLGVRAIFGTLGEHPSVRTEIAAALMQIMVLGPSEAARRSAGPGGGGGRA